MGETITKEIPFTGGYDQKTAVEYLDPSARLVTIQNGNYVKAGVVDKRLGLKHIPTSLVPGGPSGMGGLTAGTRVTAWSRSSVAAMSAASGLYALSPAENGVTAVGQLPNVRPVRRPIVAAPPPTGNDGVPPGMLCDFPFGNSTLRIGVQVGSGTNPTFYATVWDANTGDPILPPTLAFAASGSGLSYPVAVMYLPNAPAAQQVVMLFADAHINILYAVNYNPTTNAISAPTSLILPIANGVDACPFAGDPNGGFMVILPSTSTVVSWYYYLPSLSLSHTGTVETLSGTTVAGPGIYVCATYGASEVIWFAYSSFNGSTTYSYRVAAIKGDGTFTSVLAGTEFINNGGSSNPLQLSGVTRYTASSCWVMTWNDSNPASAASLAPVGNWQTVTTGGVVSAGAPVPNGMLPIARPFLVGTTLYLPCLLALYMQAATRPSVIHSQQGTIYLLQLSANTTLVQRFLPVATVAPRAVDIGAFAFQSVFFKPPLMSVVSPTGTATRYALALRVLGEDIAGATGSNNPNWSADFYFDAASQSLMYQSAEMGTELAIAAATPMVADGAILYEDGFIAYPEFAYLSGGTAGSGYTYAVVYSYIHASGLIERSAPVFTTSVTGLGATIHIPMLPVTWRDVSNPGQVFGEIFRTTLNGSTFYLVDRVSVSGGVALYATYVDNLSDSNLQVSTILYTTGGVLDNVNPPSAAMQITHRSRRVIVDETLRNTWETKAFVAGEVPGFNEALITPWPEGGDITAIGSLDDKLVVFKASSIWIRYGDGPADTGQGSDWTVPQRIASDVGAIDWRSVVLTPLGLMFQAANNGIYLLGRDLQVQFIGKNVIDLTTAFPVITSATLVPNATQVRFTCSNGLSTTVVAYDYLLSEWTTHVYSQLSANVAGTCLSSSGTYTVLSADGNIWQERPPTDSLAYADDNSLGQPNFVPQTLTTAWFRIQGEQGYMRARRLMALLNRVSGAGTAGLQIQIAFNYNPAIKQTCSWTAAQLDQAGFSGNDQPVDVHIDAHWNKGMAMQVTLSDTSGGATSIGSGQGMRFVSLLAELQQIGERYRQIPVAARR